MAKLTTRQRQRLPSKKFACPTTREYPIHDKKRVINARTRTKTFGEKCRGQTARICRAAKKFGLLDPKYKRYEGWKKFCKR